MLDSFGTKNDRDAGSPGGRCHLDQASSRNSESGGGTCFPGAIAGNEALRKADEPGSFDGCLSDGLLGQSDRLLRSRRESDIGEGDSESVHRGYSKLRGPRRQGRKSNRLVRSLKPSTIDKPVEIRITVAVKLSPSGETLKLRAANVGDRRR